jgi:hypothetical protein
MNAEAENVYKILVVTRVGKWRLGSPRKRSEFYIKAELTEIGYEGGRLMEVVWLWYKRCSPSGFF